MYVNADGKGKTRRTPGPLVCGNTVDDCHDLLPPIFAAIDCKKIARYASNQLPLRSAIYPLLSVHYWQSFAFICLPKTNGGPRFNTLIADRGSNG